MSTAPLPVEPPQTAAENLPPRTSRRRKTAHLKLVPGSRKLRTEIRARCRELAARLDHDQPLSKDEMEAISRRILDEMQLPEGYVGWTMVILASAFWSDQVAAVPPSRRLFLLPHCLKHAEGCPAEYDEFGLDCERCGACSIADFRTSAEKLGYQVLVAEGSPIVLRIIVSGYVDAIVGVGCLNVLEKAIDKVLLAGIACLAVPLLSSNCRNSSVDEDWVHEMIHLQRCQPTQTTRTYMHLLRAARQMFEPDQLERLAPRLRSSIRLTSAPDDSNGHPSMTPLAATEAIAFDFLTKGGKYARPFITLSIHDALTGGTATGADGARQLDDIPDRVKRTALAIESFHKASLIHDDIEDDDDHRYGELSVHRRFGTPTAINVGDYLIGLGYRLVSRDAAEHHAETAAAILDTLADAHLRLAEGQGAELVWREAHDKVLTPLDALKIYALKTAPAFEAALLAGVRLAGDTSRYARPLKQYARHLGVAFQILNDLNDWRSDQHNKLASGGDVLGGRPTLLWALALENLPAPARQTLIGLVANHDQPAATRLESIRRLYVQADVFEQAEQLVDKYEQRAAAIADELEPADLRRLLHYLIGTVLERPAADDLTVVEMNVIGP